MERSRLIGLVANARAEAVRARDDRASSYHKVDRVAVIAELAVAVVLLADIVEDLVRRLPEEEKK